MSNLVSSIVESSRREMLQWDFFEDSDDVEDFASNRTVPGRIVSAILNSSDAQASTVAGLLVAFAARRSLACWFLYCDDERPLEIADTVVKLWLPRETFTPSFHESWMTIIEPTENGERITDCRWSDTSSASSSVAHAARYFFTKSSLDAITALSHAFNAFDVSPITRSSNFESWLSDYAAPAAFDRRAMTSDEQFALADFEIPEPMQRMAMRRPV